MLKTKQLLGLLLASSFATTPAFAQSADIAAELRELKSQVAQLRAQSSESWMTQQRANEIKALIGEVLADADTRSSMAGSGLTAGYDKNFFLASEDGNFLLKIQGEMQSRYIYNSRDESGEDDSVGGFEQKRTRLTASGHIYDPRLQYKIKGGFANSDGVFGVDFAFVKYNFSDTLWGRVGQFKGRFLREEQVNPFAQMAVERSTVNEFFTLDFTQGIEFGGGNDAFNWSVLAYGGRERDRKSWSNDGVDFAFASRAELVLAGTQKQFKGTYMGWSGSDFGLMIGGGLDYEKVERQGFAAGTNSNKDLFQWTADISAQMDPVNVFAAVVGSRVSDNNDANYSQLGLVAQANLFILPDKWDIFMRYEYLSTAGMREYKIPAEPNTITTGTARNRDIWTFGTNYYMHKNASKVTLDFMWLPDGTDVGEPGLGTLSSTANEDQYVVRAQYQFMF